MNYHQHELIIENNNKKEEIEKVKEKTIQLTTNREALEKFARETYFMKKKNIRKLKIILYQKIR